MFTLALLALLLSIGGFLLQDSKVGAVPTWGSNSHTTKVKRASVDDYITTERPIALSHILANIGPDGSEVPGAESGIVVASPSTVNPDYFYTWTRDSALVLKQFVEAYILDSSSGGNDTSGGNAAIYQTTIENYAAAQAILQTVDNPSGNETSGGLGEPKFYSNKTAFTGDWGRPQRDGPALRAITLTLYANQLLSTGNDSYVKETLWPIIQKDLDYVAQNWNDTGFDLWEEVDGSSFFTIGNQYRSLVQGHELSGKVGSGNDSYQEQANNLLCFLQDFWSPDQGFVFANMNQENNRSRKDANSIIGSIHLFDPKAGCDPITFQPCSDKALANHKVVVDSFRSIYKINSGIASNAPVAMGRYSEDVYYDGNPWFLTTLAAAEQLYDSLAVWKSQKFLEVTSASLGFFQQFSSDIKAGNYSSDDDTYSTITDKIKSFADGFVGVVQKYTPENGSLSEQFEKSNGTELSAYDLTWSYSAFLTAAQARDGELPPSWGASGVSVNCSNNGGGGGGGENVAITFNEVASTVPGENIFLVGSISALKNWDTSSAIPLNPDNYPTWSATVNVPASTSFEYKFIRKGSDGTVNWESDPNRSLKSPNSGNFTENDTWR